MAEATLPINLADPALGAAPIAVSDDFFAPARRMLDASEPRFVPGLYDAHGKWMDGWESRRRREGDRDWCVLRIRPGRIERVVIDTRHFIGNFPAAAALEAACCNGDPGVDDWRPLLSRSTLGADAVHEFAVSSDASWTHLRLTIFPDGGVARLRALGIPDHPVKAGNGLPDLLDGGAAVHCNDMHFGHMDNLLAAAAPESMADGWETRRRREPGNDFVILRLGRPGRIRAALVDTAFFKGNYPARCSLRGARLGSAVLDIAASADWPGLLPPLRLGPDFLHRFDWQLRDIGVVDHVRLDIYPDGGVARLRLPGEPA